MDERLKDLINSVKPLDRDIEEKIQNRLDNLTKPRGSLGRLEELAKHYALIFNTLEPPSPQKVVLVFAGDHGVADEGVSAFPKEVTHQMVLNFLAGGAGINVLARHVGADVKVIDIGVDHDFQDLPGLVHKKVAKGTKNMTQGPAMSREEAVQAILAGADVALEAIQKGGYTMLATGEMGIANTTPASALTAVFCSKPAAYVTGKGTGIGDAAFQKKVEVIERAIAINEPDTADPLDVLSKLGGFEIAGICGMILAAAASKRLVVIDGFISSAGALTAYCLCPEVKEYIVAAHRSVECGHRVQLDFMGLRPLLDLDLRLGEGTGAALAMSLVEAGYKVLTEMATFEDAKVAEGEEAE